ncbi:MAG: ATP-grasp domain-containing protein, partial [Leptospiraceae bacterium]|nr:ATP-grasp domain-containing protein [Leptospiraceae bacterium]
MRILIANRGEIAVRIIRTVKDMGLIAIAVYSEADRNSLATRLADEAVYIGPSEPARSYLNIDAIIEACKTAKADAVHPGYGFLSENEAFARALEDNDIVFIGPTPATIAAMGSKIEARKIMEASGVPVVPGNNDLPDDPSAIKAIASDIGYPVLVKASAGGGGRGMRLIEEEKDLMEGIESAQREAGSAFGNDKVFLEKYIVQPRHIEIQVFGDGRGNCIHLFERECSIQRRHQKIIEESPSAALNDTVRASITEAALKAAQAVKYRGAGTVEFVYSDATQSFYFLEMNTRLQVEHPVTESVTGRDLVRDQILVAMDPDNLPAQEDIRLNGHSMEVRLYAEDPATGFMPSAGKIHVFKAPNTIRVDTGVESGSEVSLFYDPMIAKVISHGKDR